MLIYYLQYVCTREFIYLYMSVYNRRRQRQRHRERKIFSIYVLLLLYCRGLLFKPLFIYPRSAHNITLNDINAFYNVFSYGVDMVHISDVLRKTDGYDQPRACVVLCVQKTSCVSRSNIRYYIILYCILYTATILYCKHARVYLGYIVRPTPRARIRNFQSTVINVSYYLYIILLTFTRDTLYSVHCTARISIWFKAGNHFFVITNKLHTRIYYYGLIRTLNTKIMLWKYDRCNRT